MPHAYNLLAFCLGCDSQRIYFEDAKFSATTVLSQLGKVLQRVTEINEEEAHAKENLTEQVVEETVAYDYAATPTSLFRELSRQFNQREVYFNVFISSLFYLDICNH